MEAHILPSSHPLQASFPTRIRTPFLHKNQSFLFISATRPRPDSGLNATGPVTNGNGSSEDESQADTVSSAAPAAAKPRPPISTLNIRYRARSKRQAREQQQEQQNIKAPPPPKEWESMTLAEKAMELYVGEKGLLFWLNKFAYASIFITIGGWILFRFVGPSLGLYQLDAPPLSPTSILKGSP
ncbi:uncharacterized protein M6B38_288030 [Iris pallida]|uniref:Uncharacterized protein n=1 Tax=Iris pallida TaxID=29817 RepID=A0AAX6HY43_IRIPA|nr:uncharacterized protein M6B38_288030 [Iris pallida]